MLVFTHKLFGDFWIVVQWIYLEISWKRFILDAALFGPVYIKKRGGKMEIFIDSYLETAWYTDILRIRLLRTQGIMRETRSDTEGSATSCIAMWTSEESRRGTVIGLRVFLFIILRIIGIRFGDKYKIWPNDGLLFHYPSIICLCSLTY